MGKSGLIVENPFILYNNDGSYTEMYNKLISEVNLWVRKVMMILQVYI